MRVIRNNIAEVTFSFSSTAAVIGGAIGGENGKLHSPSSHLLHKNSSQEEQDWGGSDQAQGIPSVFAPSPSALLEVATSSSLLAGLSLCIEHSQGPFKCSCIYIMGWARYLVNGNFRSLEKHLEKREHRRKLTLGLSATRILYCCQG